MIENREIVKSIRKMFNKYKWMVTGLGWDISLLFLENSENIPLDSLNDAQMFVLPRWEYLEASLCVILDNITKVKESKIEEILLHELCHILVSPMRVNQTEASEEHVVTVLSRIMYRLKV